MKQIAVTVENNVSDFIGRFFDRNIIGFSIILDLLIEFVAVVHFNSFLFSTDNNLFQSQKQFCMQHRLHLA